MEHINDFTLSHYRDILSEAKKRFLIQPIGEEYKKDNRTLLLRHDADISPKAAHDVAVLEYEMGIRSTYFVLLHSPFYNFLDSENIRLFKSIATLGHEIGLHFDSHFFGTENDQQLEVQLTFEKEIIEKYLSISVKSFSFHLTNQFTKSCKKTHYAGLINAFPSFFQNDLVYCSDSFGVWRFKRLYDFLLKTEEPLIQVLTHPEWWVFDPMNTQQRIEKHIEHIQLKLQKDAQRNYIFK